MAQRFDAIVIGSGFGGAVTACRLSQHGLKVLVLERGRRWDPSSYPRKAGDPWLFSARRPEKHSGWLDLRFFKRMIIAQGAGVGGGSLTYSSVALEADRSVFTQAWPAEITYQELKPYYGKVAQMLDLQQVPDGQLTQRFKLAREAAERLGHGARFSKAPLAVTFSPDWSYDLADPFDPRHSRSFVNAHGRRQGTCIHLGNCDIGCDVQAKNTLDLNYLAVAETHGTEIRPLHLVRVIEPGAGGYRVVFDRIDGGRLIKGEAHGSRVYLAAGSLGSTELLLRCRDEHRTLPHLSRALGRHWSANANVLSMATYQDPDRVQQTVGPTISAAVDFMDGSVRNARFIVEDDGFPDLLLNSLRASFDAGASSGVPRSLAGDLEAHARSKDGLRNVMVWLGAGMDAASGELTLKRRFPAFWQRELDLQWDLEQSSGVVEAIQAMHREMTEATGGRLGADALWGRFRSLLTLHPLGGCRMGGSAAAGVVDHLGRVFGYPNLHVVDGSIVPAALGRNPALTIAALAERISAHAG